MKDRSDDTTHHERTLYHGATSRSYQVCDDLNSTPIPVGAPQQPGSVGEEVDELVEVLESGQAALLAVVVVGRQAVVAAPLDVQRAQVEAELLCVLEQAVRDRRREEVVEVLQAVLEETNTRTDVE